MFGAISAWFYKGIGGILPNEDSPGFKDFTLKPNFVEGLTDFEAEFQSSYGLILSQWKRKGEQVAYSCTIPPNSTATVVLHGEHITMNGKSMEPTQEETYEIPLTAGDYTFLISE
jgi:alpha-L-rhamnosidase